MQVSVQSLHNFPTYFSHPKLPQQKPPLKNHPYFLKTKTFLSSPKIHCGVFEESVKNRSIHHGTARRTSFWSRLYSDGRALVVALAELDIPAH